MHWSSSKQVKSEKNTFYFWISIFSLRAAYFKSNLWCPKLFQKTNLKTKQKLSTVSQSCSELKSLLEQYPIWSSSIELFFGRICFWDFLTFNPNWHETRQIYHLITFELDFVSWIFIKNFQRFLEVKIEINRDNLTPCQANWVL